MRHLSIILGLLLAATRVMAAEHDTPKITVYGTATTEVIPDQLEWLVNVHATGKDLPALAEEHSADVAAVLQFLETQSVDDAVQTSNMSLGDNEEYRDGRHIKNGYLAKTTISFRLDQLNKYRELWIGLARLKGVAIDGVTYRSSKRIQIQTETRAKALGAARDKARAMAAVLGATIGVPLAINEESQGYFSIASNTSNREASDADEAAGPGGRSIAPGRIPITARVSVIFQLRDRP